LVCFPSHTRRWDARLSSAAARAAAARSGRGDLRFARHATAAKTASEYEVLIETVDKKDVELTVSPDGKRIE
jgi:hypothetical protein